MPLTAFANVTFEFNNVETAVRPVPPLVADNVPLVILVAAKLGMSDATISPIIVEALLFSTLPIPKEDKVMFEFNIVEIEFNPVPPSEAGKT